MFTFVETGLQDCALFCASSENIYSNGRLDILSNLAGAGLQLEALSSCCWPVAWLLDSPK